MRNSLCGLSRKGTYAGSTRTLPALAPAPRPEHVGVRCLPAAAEGPRPTSGKRPLVIATRPSKLAQEQTRQVQQLLLAAAQLRDEPLQGQLSTMEIRTTGDESTSAPLRSLGAGAFTLELDRAVAGGAADLAVHSLKDCPACLEPGLLLAACLPRADPRDVLVTAEGEGAKSLGELVPGSRVGTSSSRRAAQIKHSYPHLQVVNVRGNVESRLERIRAREMSATVLALAGLQRLGKEQLATCVLSTEEMLPAACQGAVGVVCREEDEWLVGLLSSINHRSTMLEVTAERACLSALLGGGEGAGRAGETFPNFAWACNARMDPQAGAAMDIDCLVSSLDGKELFRYTEYERSVVDEKDAVALGHLYGSILRMAAVGQGWVQEEQE